MAVVDREKAVEVLSKIDVTLLVQQMEWLGGVEICSQGPAAEEYHEGLLNLLSFIRDLVDPPRRVYPGLGVNPTVEDYPINLRFLAQGMLHVPKEAIPDGMRYKSKEDIWKWALDYFAERSREELLAAVADLDIEVNAGPGCVELRDEGYTILAEIREWYVYMSKFSRELI